MNKYLITVTGKVIVEAENVMEAKKAVTGRFPITIIGDKYSSVRELKNRDAVSRSVKITEIHMTNPSRLDKCSAKP